MKFKYLKLLVRVEPSYYELSYSVMHLKTWLTIHAVRATARVHRSALMRGNFICIDVLYLITLSKSISNKSYRLETEKPKHRLANRHLRVLTIIAKYCLFWVSLFDTSEFASSNIWKKLNDIMPGGVQCIHSYHI